MELTFIQIQCVSFRPEAESPAEDIYLYGLTADGKVWCKGADEDCWEPESMQFAGMATFASTSDSIGGPHQLRG